MRPPLGKQSAKVLPLRNGVSQIFLPLLDIAEEGRELHDLLVLFAPARIGDERPVDIVLQRYSREALLEEIDQLRRGPLRARRGQQLQLMRRRQHHEQRRRSCTNAVAGVA